jgi:hypothetical protein
MTDAKTAKITGIPIALTLLFLKVIDCRCRFNIIDPKTLVVSFTCVLLVLDARPARTDIFVYVLTCKDTKTDKQWQK